ncbi:hypothetical protein AB0J83_26555 [Actinoplanes sp. NPDC049596]|uniref:hypothetical protein n=1 Tax=unclassified Actinoplanes TaxID=2626549 RepID=UPI003444C7F1
MTRFAMAHLDGGQGLLKPATLGQMQTAQTDVGYGLGWRDTDLDGTRIVRHAGATPGFWAHLILVPSAGLGVIVLAGSYSPALDARLASIGFTITRLALGHSPHAAPPPDPLIRGTLSVLVALAGLLALTFINSAVRRSGRAPFWWATAWMAVAALAVAALPAAMGYSLP